MENIKIGVSKEKRGYKMMVDFNKLINEVSEMHTIAKKMEKEMSSKVEKRWLTVRELSKYIGYSTNTIYKMINVEFFFNVHYYKPTGKVMFDKFAIDDWIRGSGAVPCNVISNEMIDKLLTA
jgi:predicted DNA-binding transcriptional regulator AlpA